MSCLKKGLWMEGYIPLFRVLDLTFAINCSALDDCRLESVIRKRRYNDNLVVRVQTQT